MKAIKICHYCGKKYYVNQSQKDRSKFCSDECFRRNKDKQVSYICDQRKFLTFYYNTILHLNYITLMMI